jgi:hypothetical protein
LPHAVTVRVVTESTGRRTTVSHFNKAAKGRLARALVSTRSEPATVTGLVRVARSAGLHLERTGDLALDLVVD